MHGDGLCYLDCALLVSEISHVYDLRVVINYDKKTNVYYVI